MIKPKPDWLKIKLYGSNKLNEVVELLNKLSLHTVCEEANCPNLMECFSKKTATFMILGRICTRNCTFCSVTKGNVDKVDTNEPGNIAQAALQLNLKHVVITSVTRDDLSDGGAGHFANVIRKIQELSREIVIEVLIPDFKGDSNALQKVVTAKPEIINHNIETIPRLYSMVRPMAVYERSLELLKNVKLLDNSIYTKSGIMVGLGETVDEVIYVLKDLRNVGCDFITIGQYLAPSKNHYPVAEYIHPDIFEMYKKTALEIGFKHAASAPLVRSSYHADDVPI